MSFPNPDNYGRSCDCGPENTTPPPSDIQAQLDALQDELATAETEIDTLQSDVNDLQTTIITSGPDRGEINTSGNLSVPFGGVGGDIYTYGAYGFQGGSISLQASSTGNGGSINLSSIAAGTDAPSILCGTGIPSLSAVNGSIYLRVNGTASTTLYVRAGGSWSALS
jgi:hypothetical protein